MPITKASGQAVAPAAKGDLVVGSATNDAAVLGVGSADQVLTVDSSTTTGLKWATPSAGGMTLISTTTLSGASVTLSSIPQTYVNLYLIIQNFKPSVDNAKGQIRINADSTANRHKFMRSDGVMDGSTATTFDDTSIRFMGQNDNNVANGLNTILFHNYTNTTTWKLATIAGATVDGTTTTSLQPIFGLGIYNQTSAITSLVLLPESGNFTSGTALLYGVK